MLKVDQTLRIIMNGQLVLATTLLFCLPVYGAISLPQLKDDSLDPQPTQCCRAKGGVQYCDSSAGRYVCSDGDYSSCYCNRHAVMDLQKIQGCCLWQGGVLKKDPTSGLIVCNNGSVSEMCSAQDTIESKALGVSEW